MRMPESARERIRWRWSVHHLRRSTKDFGAYFSTHKLPFYNTRSRTFGHYKCFLLKSSPFPRVYYHRESDGIVLANFILRLASMVAHALNHSLE